MAGHSQFKNIMHRKGAQDAKRAKQFTKLTREIIVATKSGGVDEEFNPRLRKAVAAAKAANLPKSRIDNAINKALDNDSENYEEVTYECYLPNKIALIVETLTDNRNRTSGEIRSLMSKRGGNLATEGSALYLFDRVGLIQIHDSDRSEDEVFELAINAGASDYKFNKEEGVHEIYCLKDDLHEVQKNLSSDFNSLDSASLIWKPQAKVEVTSPEDAKSILTVIEMLQDLDDVQNIYANYEIPQCLLKV